MTPLMFAAKSYGDGIVALLLASGALPHIRDKSGRTALHHAVEGQRIDHVLLLVAAGADAAAPDNQGVTPIGLAVSCHMTDVVCALTGCDPEEAQNYRPITVNPYAELRATQGDREGGDGECPSPFISRPDELDGVEPVAHAEDAVERPFTIRPDELDGIEAVTDGEKSIERPRTDKEKKRLKKAEKRARREAAQAACLFRIEAPYSQHEMITLEVTAAHITCAVTGPERLRHRWSHDEVLEGEADATIVRRFGQTVLDQVRAVIAALQSMDEMATYYWIPQAPGTLPGFDNPVSVLAEKSVFNPIGELLEAPGPGDPSEATGSADRASSEFNSGSQSAASTSLIGMTVVFTGTLSRFTRSQAAALVTERGGKVTSSIGVQTSLVVAGDNAGAKLERARELGIAVFTEEQFCAMLSVL